MVELSAIAKRNVARRKSSASKRRQSQTNKKSSSSRRTATSLGLTGEDIAKIVKRTDGKVTSKILQDVARKKAFRQTNLRKSGTAESLLKPRTVEQLKRGQLQTRGGFSIIDGVLVPTRIANKVSDTLNLDRQLKTKERARLQEFGRLFLSIKMHNLEQGFKKQGKEKIIIPKGKPSGSIEAVIIPKKFVDRLAFKLTQAKETQQTKISRLKSDQPAQRIFRGIVVLGAIGAARGVSDLLTAISKPKQTAIALYQAAKQPGKTIKSLFHEFEINPVGTLTRFYSFNKGLNAATSLIKRSKVGRFVQEEFFIRNQPKQIQPAVRAIIKSSKAQEVINPFKIKSIKSVNFAKVKNLTKIEAKAVKQAIQKTDSIVFGSLASRTLSKGKTKIPGDVDLATKSISTFNKEFINALPRNARNNYIIKAQKILRKSNKQPLLDIKPLNRLFPGKSIFNRRGFLPVSGYVTLLKAPKGSILPKLSKRPGISKLTIPTQKVIKLDKIKLIGFGEQTTRKGLGTLQVLIEKNARRAKDPQAFVESLQLQIEQLKITKPRTTLGMARKKARIERISNALDILTNKSFARLLEKKVPGITRQYPILKKISIAKLKKVKKLPITKIRKRIRAAISKKKPKISKVAKKIRSIVKKRIIKKRRVISKTKASRLAKVKKKPSKIPTSRLQKKPSRIPSRIPSRLTPKFISKLTPKQQSKLKKLIISKIPRSVISKIPLSTLSRTPITKISKLQSTVSRLSRVPQSKLSKLTINRIKKVMTPKQIKKIKKKSEEDKLKRKVKKAVKNRTFIFISDLFSIITGEKASPRQKKLLLKKGRIFTGFETRKLV